MNYYLGARIKELREERHWTQAELAARLNKSVSTVSGYESDAHPMPLDVFISMAELFNVSLDELAGAEKATNISLAGLTNEQVKIITSLKVEYLMSTGHRGDLTDTQMRILHDIIMSFLNR